MHETGKGHTRDSEQVTRLQRESFRVERSLNLSRVCHGRPVALMYPISIQTLAEGAIRNSWTRT